MSACGETLLISLSVWREETVGGISSFFLASSFSCSARAASIYLYSSSSCCLAILAASIFASSLACYSEGLMPYCCMLTYNWCSARDCPIESKASSVLWYLSYFSFFTWLIMASTLSFKDSLALGFCSGSASLLSSLSYSSRCFLYFSSYLLMKSSISASSFSLAKRAPFFLRYSACSASLAFLVFSSSAFFLSFSSFWALSLASRSLIYLLATSICSVRVICVSSGSAFSCLPWVCYWSSSSASGLNASFMASVSSPWSMPIFYRYSSSLSSMPSGLEFYLLKASNPRFELIVEARPMKPTSFY